MDETKSIDLRGMRCPIPIVELHMATQDLGEGEELTAIADDPAFCMDVEAWCRRVGFELMSLDKSDGIQKAVIRKLDAEAA